MENLHTKTQSSSWLDLIFNIALPSLIMMKGSGEDQLGPVWGLVIALAFPLGYGLYDFIKKRKINFFSILGLVSILLTGGISLLKLNPHWIAVKEAAIPGVLGLVVLISLKTKTQLIRKILLNDNIFDTGLIESALQSKNNEAKFEKRLIHATYLLSLSFFVSSLLNYVLAKVLLKSEPGTVGYTEELGKMTAMSYPVIVLPSLLMMGFALWFLFSGIKKLTGLEIGMLMHKKES